VFDGWASMACETRGQLLRYSRREPKVVQERLGPANMSLTLQVYSHVLPGMQEETPN